MKFSLYYNLTLLRTKLVAIVVLDQNKNIHRWAYSSFSMRWNFEVIFNKNVSKTETIISACAISKYSKLMGTLPRLPTNAINIKILLKK